MKKIWVRQGRGYSTALMIMKYAYAAVLTAVAAASTGKFQYMVIGAAELTAIFLFSNAIVKRRRGLGAVLNGLLCLLYNAQMTVLLFSNSFVQPIMLGNLRSLEDLGGKTLQYGLGAVLAIGCAFLPCREIQSGSMKRTALLRWLLPGVTGIECLLVLTFGWGYSPAFSYCSLAAQEWKTVCLRRQVEMNNAEAYAFFQPTIPDGRTKENALGSAPNVIVIFTEGLSQNIVHDPREIMPNLAELEKNSLNFVEYYNHTCATYRGLIGQLYSGYQLDNLDPNYLVSIQGILHSQNYRTAFINTEPLNKDFTAYIQSFGFDEVIGTEADTRSGMVGSYSDREAYELLYNTACRMQDSNSPFFLCIYTFGTHVSLDSVDEVYEDGSNRLLNRFYNVDVQLGNFLERFNASGLAENTFLVFTADHATYCDNDFAATFPDYHRKSTTVDEIPLCFYYRGIRPEQIDVGGRNALCLAPTILDYLNIDSPNYFLGTSLFCAESDGDEFDTTYNEGPTLFSTKNGIIQPLTEQSTAKLEPLVQMYFKVKLQDQMSRSDGGEYVDVFSSAVKTRYCDDGMSLEVIYSPSESLNNRKIWFSIWSAENNQDDLICYPATLGENETWRVTIDLRKHTVSGELIIHVYSGYEEPTEYLDSTREIIYGG